MPQSRPRLKIVRRFGTALPGLTAKDHQKRDFPPGQLGVSPSRRKKSLYRQRLEEKQKVRFNYGVTERQLRNIFEEAGKLPGVTGHNLLALLERRLSNVVFRLGFARTIPAARQLVAHRHILVDGKTVDRPSYRVRRGQSITLRPSSREIPAVVESTTKGPRLKVPSYLALDPSSSFEGKVIADPIRADASVVVDDAAIVEFYAQ